MTISILLAEKAKIDISKDVFYTNAYYQRWRGQVTGEIVIPSGGLRIILMSPEKHQTANYFRSSGVEIEPENLTSEQRQMILSIPESNCKTEKQLTHREIVHKLLSEDTPSQNYHNPHTSPEDLPGYEDQWKRDYRAWYGDD